MCYSCVGIRTNYVTCFRDSLTRAYESFIRNLLNTIMLHLLHTIPLKDSNHLQNEHFSLNVVSKEHHEHKKIKF